MLGTIPQKPEVGNDLVRWCSNYAVDPLLLPAKGKCYILSHLMYRNRPLKFQVLRFGMGGRLEVLFKFF